MNKKRSLLLLLVLTMIATTAFSLKTLTSSALSQDAVATDEVFNGTLKELKTNKKVTKNGTEKINITLTSDNLTDNQSICIDDCKYKLDRSNQTIQIDNTSVDELKSLNNTMSGNVDLQDVDVIVTQQTTSVVSEYTITNGNEEYKEGDQISKGDLLTYTFTVTNSGTQTNDINVSIDLDAEFETFVENSLKMDGKNLEYKIEEQKLNFTFPITSETSFITYQTEVNEDSNTTTSTKINATYDNNYDAKEQEITAEIKGQAPRTAPATRGKKDFSDAPESYGETNQHIGIPEEVLQSGEDFLYPVYLSLYQNQHQSLALGYDIADPDLDDSDFAGESALGDDEAGENGTTTIDDETSSSEGWDQSYYADDETGFKNHNQLSTGEIPLNPYERNLQISVPYLNSKQFTEYVNSRASNLVDAPIEYANAQVLIWIDFNVDGTFTANEGIKMAAPSYTYTQEGNTSSNYRSAYQNLSFAWDLMDSKLDIDREKIISNGTYMRAVITTDSDYTLDDAATSPQGDGEIEDYKIKGIANSDTTCGYTLINNQQMVPETVTKVSDSQIKYSGIVDSYGEKFDVVVTTTGIGTVEDYSQAGEEIYTSVLNDNGNNLSGDATFSYDFYEPGTTTPKEVPIQLVVEDIEFYEQIIFDKEPISFARENDSLYNLAGSTLEQDLSDYPNGLTTIIGGSSVDLGSAAKITLNFGMVDHISGNWKRINGVDTATASALDLTLLSSADAPVDCNATTPTVVKSSSLEEGTQTSVGDQIDYTVDVAIPDSFYILDQTFTITDKLSDGLDYVDTSGSLDILDVNGNVSDTDVGTVTYDSATKTITATYGGVVDEYLVGGETLRLSYSTTVNDVLAAPETIDNTANVNYNTTDYPSNTTSVLAPILDETNPEETLIKTVIAPSTGVVTPGENVQYQIETTLSEAAHTIKIIDGFDDPYLSFESIDSVQLNGTDYTNYFDASSINNGLKVFLYGDFSANDTISVVVNGKVSDDLPVYVEGEENAVTLTNVATGTVDGTVSKPGSGIVTTDPDGNIPDGNLITAKTISDESGTEDGVLEFGEEVTYTISMENITEADINATVKDDLASQNLNDYFDIDNNQVLVKVPTATETTPSIPTISDLSTTGIDVVVPANESVEISFTLTAKDEENFPLSTTETNINNIATITDPSNPDKPYKPISPILPPTGERNPQETVKKTVVTPTDGLVAAGDSVQYKIEVGPLQEKAHFINVKDAFSDPYLSFESIDSVQLNGTNYTGSQIDNSNILTGVNLTLLGNFNINDTITVTVTGKVSDDLPINEETGELESVSLTNVAIANVDGTVSKPDGGVVITDPNVELPNEKLITSKSIISEDGTVDGTLEPEETIKYAISLENVTETTMSDIIVKDDLVEQGFDKYFDINPTEPLILNPDDALVNPTEPKLADLMNGMEVTVPGNSTVTIMFDLTALAESELPYSDSDEEIINIASIIDPTNPEGPYNPVIPILPPIVTERDPSEQIDKTLISPTSGIVVAGDNVKYEIQVGPLTEKASTIEINDAFTDDYISFDSLNSVKVNGTAFDGQLIDLSNPLDGLKLTLLDDFKRGDIITVEVTGKVSDDIPTDEIVTLTNVATGTVDGTESKPGQEIITTDPDGNLPTEGNFITTKTISKESMTEDNTLEFGEEITYTLGIENITDEDIGAVEVSDDLLGQGLDQFFDIDQAQTLVLNPTDAAVTPATPTIANLIAGITVDVPANSKVEISFTLTVKSEDEFPFGVDANIDNIATITDPTDPGGPYNPVKPILPPKGERDPKEKLTKEVVDPIDGVVVDPSTDGSVQYKISLGALTEKANTISIRDNMEDSNLQATSVDSITLDGNAYSLQGGDIAEVQNGQVVVLLNGDFPKGSVIDVEVSAEVSSSAPAGINIANKATAKVDGTATNNDIAYVNVGSTTVAPDSPLYTRKDILDESGLVDGTLEYKEKITYGIYVENTGETDKTGIVIKDDLKGQNLDQIFNWNDADAVTVNPSTIITTPSAPTMADLTTDGITFDLQPGESAEFEFTLNVNQAGGFPELIDLNEDGVEDTTIGNNASVLDPDFPNRPISPNKPILPPAKPIEHGKETLIKETLDSDKIVQPGDAVQYSLAIDLQEDASTITFEDSFDNSFLDYVGVNSVKVNGRDYAYTEDTNFDGMKITLNGNFLAGTYFEVTVDTKVLDTAIDGTHIPNKAVATTDGTKTNTAVENISVGDDTGVVTDPNIYANKSIVSESGDKDGVLEPSEEVTYAIDIENLTDIKIDDIIVKDDILGSELSKYFDVTSLDTLPLTIKKDNAVVTPDPSTVANLTDGTGILVDLPAFESVTIEFTLTALDDATMPTVEDASVPIINIANVIDPTDPGTGGPDGGGLLPGVPILPPFVIEKNPEEILTKSVVKEGPLDLTPNNVAPGDIVKYSIKIDEMQETAHSLEIKDAVSNKYLTYTQLISVHVDGKAVSFDQLSTTSLDIRINKPVEKGSSVEVVFSAKVSQTAPDGISIDNEAFGVVDGTETLHDSETVVVGNGDVPTDTGLYTEKTILNEDGNVTGILEPSETVTYQIKVANVGDTQQVVNIKDDFIAQGLDQIYTWNDTDALGVNTSGTVTYTPNPATIAALQTGIEVTLDAKSAIEFSFDLKVKDETDLPSIIDIDGDGETDPKILNIATITGGTGEILVPGVDIFLPELKPLEPLSIEKEVTPDNMDGLNPWKLNEEYVYTITVTNPNENAVNDVEVVDDFQSQKLNNLFYLTMDSEDIDVIYSDSTPDEQITPNELQSGKLITVPASGNVKFEFKLTSKVLAPDIVNNTTGEYGTDNKPDETVNNTATMTYNGTTSESTATIYGTGGDGRSATNNPSETPNVGGTSGDSSTLYNTGSKVSLLILFINTMILIILSLRFMKRYN